MITLILSLMASDSTLILHAGGEKFIKQVAFSFFCSPSSNFNTHFTSLSTSYSIQISIHF